MLQLCAFCLLIYVATYVILSTWKGGEKLSKKKAKKKAEKKESDKKVNSQQSINLITTILNLITALLILITKLKE